MGSDIQLLTRISYLKKESLMFQRKDASDLLCSPPHHHAQVSISSVTEEKILDSGA